MCRISSVASEVSVIVWAGRWLVFPELFASKPPRCRDKGLQGRVLWQSATQRAYSLTRSLRSGLARRIQPPGVANGWVILEAVIQGRTGTGSYSDPQGELRGPGSAVEISYTSRGPYTAVKGGFRPTPAVRTWLPLWPVCRA